MLHNGAAKILLLWERREIRWGLLLAVIALLLRVLLWMTYQPIEYGDTSSYFRLAEILGEHSFAGYDATRVPAYPLLLVYANLDPLRVWAIQLLMGWLISLSLFWLGWKSTENPVFGYGIGLTYTLVPGQLLFESALLTETLTSFWLILSLTLLKLFEIQKKTKPAIAIAFVLGLTVSLAGLTRPLFYPLSLWLLPFVWLLGRDSKVERVKTAVAYCVAPLFLLGGWLLFVYGKYGMLSPTTMAGYSLVQHTGEYFDYLPDEEAAIRDTYIIYRDAQIAEGKTQTNAIWEAIPAMTQESGLNFFSLSHKLQSLSFMLIREYPDMYLRNVLQGWVDFWKAPVYWKPDLVDSSAVRLAFQALTVIGRGFSIVANVIFLVIAFGSMLFRRVREYLKVDRYLIATSGAILLTSFIQTLVDHGDNPRFLVPLQIMVIFVVYQTLSSWKGKVIGKG